MPNKVIETWRWVVGYEGKYQVSDLGNLRSWSAGNGRPGCKPSEPKPMKPTPNYSGYRVVSLGDGTGKKKQHRLHCLVLEAFVGPRPEGFQGCHHDDDKGNNRLSNLAWKSVGDNTCDRSVNDRTASGARHGRYKTGQFVGQHRRYYTNKYVK